MKKKMAAWLINKYLEWQQGEGSLRTQAEFAEYLGIKPSTLSMWMSGKQNPDQHSADLLAAKLGPEIYDILDLPRPPHVISEFESNYGTIPPSEKSEFEEDFDKWLADWFKAHGLKRIK